jgi:hypothetical protein
MEMDNGRTKHMHTYKWDVILAAPYKYNNIPTLH